MDMPKNYHATKTQSLDKLSLADVRQKAAVAATPMRSKWDRDRDSPEGAVVRPKVGPADPATVKKMLTMRLAEKQPLTAQPKVKAMPEPKLGLNPTRNLRIARQRRDDQINRNSEGYE